MSSQKSPDKFMQRISQVTQNVFLDLQKKRHIMTDTHVDVQIFIQSVLYEFHQETNNWKTIMFMAKLPTITA